MAAVSLAPMAGAQGEFAGVAMIRAYHDARGDHARTRDPRARCGARHQSRHRDDVRLHGARDPHRARWQRRRRQRCAQAVGPHTAGLMLTNPSTLGVFERSILEIARHRARCRRPALLRRRQSQRDPRQGASPGAMGFDVMHMNLHKTFSTPHGGGGPGAGPVGVRAQHLQPFLPMPMVVRDGDALSLAARARPAADHRPAVGAHGQCRRAAARLCLRAHARTRRHAPRRRVRDAQRQLPHGASSPRPASSSRSRSGARATSSSSRCKALKDETGVTAMDFAKRLLDKGFHAPTTYFPLLVPECLLIEPTETESKADARCLRRGDEGDPARGA